MTIYQKNKAQSTVKNKQKKVTGVHFYQYIFTVTKQEKKHKET